MTEPDFWSNTWAICEACHWRMPQCVCDDDRADLVSLDESTRAFLDVYTQQIGHEE